MNKIYRLRFDRRRNELVVVSEITAGTGKEKSTGHIAGPAALSPFRKLMGTLTPLAFLTGLVISLLPGMALAADLPTGGQIVAGQGSITTNGNHMTVNQNTHGLVTNWNSFDIGQNHTVQFVQPDSSSVALNRVTGGHESQILGSLTANGQVMLVNPAGVMFGNGSKVNTAGLVASTKNISNADFMAGHYTFSGGSHPGAGVVNQGSLTTTKGGYIVLAADRVRNQGTIITPGGKTVLAAADTVKLQLDNTGLTSVSVSGNVVNALVENSGLLSATNGQVYLTARGRDMLLNTVVNNTGSIEAKGLESRGGEIVLDGGDSGVVSQSGMLLADSDTGPGGKITVEGQNIHLAAGSITSATGRAGGGEVYVGGGWQGKDSHIRNASKVVMDKTATIDVSATERGDGGTAVLWSEDYTNFNGNILAQGGAQSGNGGRVETSSHNNLQAFGTVDASASGSGKGGEWLLDPGNVNIVSDNNNTSISEDKENNLFTPTAAGARLSAKQIETQLNAGTSVTVSTSGNGGQDGNIYFAAGTTINKTEGDEVTLTLKADKDIVFTDRGWPDRNAITATGGVNNKLNLKLLTGSSGGNGQITIGKAVNISLNGGDFYAGPAEGSAGKTKLVFNDNGGVQAGNIALDTANGTTVNWSQLTANNNLTVNGPLDVTAAWSAAANLTAGGLLKIDIPTGGITATSIAKKGNGKVQLSGGDGVEITAQNGTVTMNADKDEQHGISIKSDNGSVNISGKTDKLNTTGVSLSGITLNAANNIVISGENTYSGQLAPSIIHGNWEPGVQNFVRGVNLTSANIAAKNINITGVMSGKLTTGGGSRSSGGVVLSDINMAASEKLNVTGNSTGVYSAYNMGQSGGIYITGNVKAKASQGSITGEGYANGITTYGTGTIDLTGDISVTGNNLKSYNGYSAGILFSGSWNQPTGYAFNVANGSNVTITGNGINKGVAVLGEAASSTSVSLKNQGGNVTLLGYASGDSGQGIALISDVDSGNQDKGNIILSGNGKTSLSGVAMGANGTGISKVTINTTAVTDGNASLSGSGGKNGLTINASSNISNVSITGKGETGTGVLIKGGASLSNTTITGNTDSGIGLNISGATTSDSHTVLTGTANSGTGVIVGASLSGGGEVTGSSDSGTGVLLDGGDISGGTLTAMSVTGTGLEVRSASVATDVTISAQTVTGNAISGEDKTLDAQGSTTISTVGDTGNANISENVSPSPGGKPSGVVAEVLALKKLNADIASLQDKFSTKFADLDAMHTAVVKLQAQLGQAGNNDELGQADLKHLGTIMEDLSDRLNAATTLNEAFSALKTATGPVEERQKTADNLSGLIQTLSLPSPGNVSAVAGELAAAKKLHSDTVSLQSGLTDKAAEGIKIQRILDSAQEQLKKVQENGITGGAALQGIQTQLEKLNEQQQSERGTLEHFRQMLEQVSHDGSSSVAQRQERVDGLLKAISGTPWITVGQVSGLGSLLMQAASEYAQVVAATQGQSSVNAQMPLLNRVSEDGFHAGGKPAVPVSGYREPSQNTNISVCDSDGCKSVTLNVGEPASANYNRQ